MSNVITGVVHSSHGTIVIDARTGHIIGADFEGNDTESIAHLESITRFDLSEYQNFYPDETEADHGNEYDILDLGYWHDDGEEYEEPDHEWRKLVKEEFAREAALRD